jgi:hypothetical protein
MKLHSMTIAAAPHRPVTSARLAKTTAERATMDPAEKSKPPLMMTNVMPTAAIPTGALWLTILRIFANWKRPG